MIPRACSNWPIPSPAANVADYGIRKAIEHLPQLRAKLSSVIDRYLNVQQDILETFVDRGQLRQLAHKLRAKGLVN